MGVVNLDQYQLSLAEVGVTEPQATVVRARLVNTGAIIDTSHTGELANAKTERDPICGFDVPTECPGVPREIRGPGGVRANASACDTTAKRRAGLFRANFKKYASNVSAEITAGGPA